MTTCGGFVVVTFPLIYWINTKKQWSYLVDSITTAEFFSTLEEYKLKICLMCRGVPWGICQDRVIPKDAFEDRQLIHNSLLWQR